MDTGGFRPHVIRTEGIAPTASTPLAPIPWVTRQIMKRPGPRPHPSTPQGRLTNGVVTPYASFLALRFAPREAMENLRKLKENFPIYGDHGFMDSVNVSSGVVADRVLILDQGMIMAAIANALADDAMRSRLHRSRKRADPPALDRPGGVYRGTGT